MRAFTLLLILGVALAAPGDRPKVDPVRIPAIVDLNNAKCPMSGEEVKGDDHIDWNGVRVHFCCGDCPKDFAKDPAAALGKLGLKVVKDDAGKMVVDLGNTKCPVMGKAAKPDMTADQGGVRMHFCCGNCPKKVAKDPAPAYKALGYGYIPSVVDLRNAACPTSGKATDEKVFADQDGIRVHFCCPDCIGAFEKDPAGTFAKLGVDPAKVKETK